MYRIWNIFKHQQIILNRFIFRLVYNIWHETQISNCLSGANANLVKMFPCQDSNPWHQCSALTFYRVNHMGRHPARDFSLLHVGKTTNAAQDGIFSFSHRHGANTKHKLIQHSLIVRSSLTPLDSYHLVDLGVYYYFMQTYLFVLCMWVVLTFLISLNKQQKKWGPMKKHRSPLLSIWFIFVGQLSTLGI